MRARLRRFLLLLLMLTLPGQAFAYSAMQVSILADRAPMPMERMAMPGEAPVMADCHTSDQPHPPSGQHECKFCAACALATAIPVGFADRTPVVPIAHRFAPQPAASFSGFIPDSLDRPPRTALA